MRLRAFWKAWIEKHIKHEKKKTGIRCHALLYPIEIRNIRMCNKCCLVRPYKKDRNFGGCHGCHRLKKGNFQKVWVNVCFPPKVRHSIWMSKESSWHFLWTKCLIFSIGMDSSKIPLFFLQSKDALIGWVGPNWATILKIILFFHSDALDSFLRFFIVDWNCSYHHWRIHLTALS